jgi:acyl carrier protein
MQPPPVPPKKKRLGTTGIILVAVAAVSVAFVLFQAVMFAIVLSKTPRTRTPGEAEFREANRQIIRSQGGVAFGNNSAAVSLARDYSMSLKVLREGLFSKGNKDAYSISKGEFLTYCQLNANSCVFLVHVPELRRFTSDAQKSLSELAWMNAQSILRTRSNSPPATLAVGVKGAVLYESVMIGHAAPDSATGDGITERGSGVTGPNLLYRFFAPTTAGVDKDTLPTIDRVRLEAATILGTTPDKIDPKKPLAEQGADELDIVEIVMALEEAFQIEIPDSAIGGTPEGADKTLSIEQLAKIVAEARTSK